MQSGIIHKRLLLHLPFYCIWAHVLSPVLQWMSCPRFHHRATPPSVTRSHPVYLLKDTAVTILASLRGSVFFFLHFIFLIIHTCYFVLHEKKQNKQKHTVLCIIYSNSHPLSFPPFTPKLFPEVLPTCCHQFLSSHFLWNLPYHSFHPSLSLVSALVYIFNDCPLLTQFSDFVVLNLTASLDRPDPLPSWSRMSHVPGYFLLCQSHMLLIYQIYQCWFDHKAQFLDFSSI